MDSQERVPLELRRTTRANFQVNSRQIPGPFAPRLEGGMVSEAHSVFPNRIPPVFSYLDEPAE